MAEEGGLFGSCSSESAITSNPEQRSLRWCLKNDNLSLSEVQRTRDEVGDDSNKRSGVVTDDIGDDSGLELSLGLSLGGSASKAKPRNEAKIGIGVEQRYGKNMNEETCSRKLSRRNSDGSVSRTQAFWQEFGISRDSERIDKSRYMTSNPQLRERHPSSVTSLSGQISSVSSLGFSDAWRSADNSAGEEPKVGFAHQFWQSMQEKCSQPKQVNKAEELPIFQDLSGPSTRAGASSSGWARYGAMPLLDRFKETAEEKSRAQFPVRETLVSTACATVPNNLLQLRGHFDFDQPRQLASARSDGSPHEDIGMLAPKRHSQDPLEQQKKQTKQEARKRRKAFMEEQKLQKKSKKEDEYRIVPGNQKHISSRPDTPTSSRLSPSPPLQANFREVSSPPNSLEARSASAELPRSSSRMWARGGSRDGVAVSSPENTPERELGPNDGKPPLLERRRAFQRHRDIPSKEKLAEVDSEKETEPRKDSKLPVRGFGQIEKGDELNGTQSDASHIHGSDSAPAIRGLEMNKVQADAAWVQRMLERQMSSESAYQMAAALMENKELFPRGPSDRNGLQKRGPENVSSFGMETAKLLGTSTLEQPDRSGERIRLDRRNGEALSVKSDAGNRTNAASGGGSNPASGSMVTIGAYSQPSNFPLMHMAYPFPVPVAGPNGMPFPLPYQFPFRMQFADSAPALDRATSLPNSFQVAPNPSYPTGDLRCRGWTPVLRPQATPPHSPQRPLARSSSGIVEEDSRTSQGIKSGGIVRSSSPAKDDSPVATGHGIPRASSLCGLQGRTGAVARARPPTSLPPAAQFGLVRTRAKSGDAILHREGSSINSNGAFASVVEASQSLPAAVAHASTSKSPAGQRVASVTKLEGASSCNLPDAVDEKAGGTSNTKPTGQQLDTPQSDSGSRLASNEDAGKIVEVTTSHEGTTTSASTSKGIISQMGEEGSSLKLGCAAGQALTLGDSGASPDLPWVTCKGAGPNGKTTSGVLYRFDKGPVRIICACHGRHMSAGEFVQHAGSEDISNPEKSIVVGPFPPGSQAASA